MKFRLRASNARYLQFSPAPGETDFTAWNIRASAERPTEDCEFEFFKPPDLSSDGYLAEFGFSPALRFGEVEPPSTVGLPPHRHIPLFHSWFDSMRNFKTNTYLL